MAHPSSLGFFPRRTTNIQGWGETMAQTLKDLGFTLYAFRLAERAPAPETSEIKAWGLPKSVHFARYPCPIGASWAEFQLGHAKIRLGGFLEGEGVAMRGRCGRMVLSNQSPRDARLILEHSGARGKEARRGSSRGGAAPGLKCRFASPYYAMSWV